MNITSENGQTTELLSKYDVEGTPFQIIEDKEKGVFFGVMGQYRLTETYEFKDDLEKDLVDVNWNRVIQVIMLLNEKFNVNDLLKEEE